MQNLGCVKTKPEEAGSVVDFLPPPHITTADTSSLKVISMTTTDGLRGSTDLYQQQQDL